MKVHFGKRGKPHRGGAKTLPPPKTPQRETSRNPEKRLRQPPRAAACAGNVGTGQGGAEKRHLEEEEGERGLQQLDKKPVRVARLLEQPNERNCPQ